VADILDRSDKSIAPTFGAAGNVSKKDKFNWVKPGAKGKYMEIDKRLLHIEGDYQRPEQSEKKVKQIAANWDWPACGVILVGQREDGSYYVIDGGHRVRGSFYRDDIYMLPCLVFEFDSVSDEAKAFLRRNTSPTMVKSHDKFRAGVTGKIPEALAAKRILDKYGYKLKVHGGGKKAFAGIAALQRLVSVDEELTDRVFGICATIAEDEHFSSMVLQGLFEFAKKFRDRDVLCNGFVDKLARVGATGCDAIIKRFFLEVQAGGAVNAARAITRFYNKGKRKGRLEW